jgi:capsule polysaccharide export protein KpsE/RkpR
MFGALGSAGSLLRGLPGLARRSLGGSGGTYNYFAILKSREAMEAVVRKFNLMGEYGITDSSMEKAVKALSGNTAFDTQDDDNITIEVFDRDPLRAADIANYFVELLNGISVQLGTKEAGSNREFIETRLDGIYADLRRAEDSLQAYQERTGMLIVPEGEGASGIGPIAELYGMKARKDLELAIAKRTATGDNPALKQLEVEVGEINKKIGGIPGIGVESLRLYRNVAIQQKIIEFLVPLYEQAKINEHKDIPVLLVLDRAVPAEKKSKPQRMLIVFLACVLTLALSVLLALLMQGVFGPEGATVFERRVQKAARRVARFYRVRIE